MATKTPLLGLILPANGEYVNTWNQPNNTNFSIIDTILGGLQEEIVAAQGSADNLADRLAVAMDDAGNPLPTAEVIAARVSGVYGGFNPEDAANQLGDVIEYGDVETWTARQELNQLIDALAWTAGQNKPDCVISGPPSYLTSTGAIVSLNGSVTNVIANINGYRQVVRNILTQAISGGAGTYYLKLTRTPGGVPYINTGVTASGAVGTYITNGLVSMLTDTGMNFVTSGVQPGDVLQVTGPGASPNIGQYIVLATSVQDPTNLTINSIAVIGVFPAVANVSYTLTNPISPALGFTATAPTSPYAPLSNYIYVGQCAFDGTNVTSVTAYQTLATYAGFAAVVPVSGNYSLTIPHNIGYMPRKVSIYGSQASNFSQPLELLASDQVSGGGALQRSAITKMDNLNVYVKNATNGIFYQDFGGVNQASGYLYVVVER